MPYVSSTSRRSTAVLCFAAWLTIVPSLDAQAVVDSDTLRLTLAEAHRLALERNPTYRASALAPAIARGDLRQDRAFAPNPEVEIEAPDAATTGSVDGYEAWAWQEIEWAGQRGLRIEAGESRVEVARATALEAARAVVAEASRAFFATLAARRRLAVAEELLTDNARLLEAVEIRLAEGEISALDADVAGVEAGQLAARTLAVRRDLTAAEIELGRVLGLPPSTRVDPVIPEDEPRPPPPASLDADSIAETALSRRADVAALRADVERSRLANRLAGREAIPNLRLGLRRGREGGAEAWGLGVGLELPVWNRNGGLSDRTEAEHGQARFALAAGRLQTRAQVSRALSAYATARERARVYEESVLEPARLSRRRLVTAYDAGKIGLTELLILRGRLLDAELGYWDAWLDLRTAWIDLQEASASMDIPDIPDVTSNGSD